MTHEEQMLKEAKKQTNLARRSLSQQSCCIGGCAFLILLFFFPGIFAGGIAILGLGAIVQSGTSQSEIPPATNLSPPQNSTYGEPHYVPPAEEPQQHEDNSFIAYYAKGIYHKSKTCKDLEGELVGGGLSDQLDNRGMMPCRLCVSVAVPKLDAGPIDTTVVFTANKIYHLTKLCTALGNERPAAALMSKALELQMKPCPLCIAPPSSP